LRTVPCSGLSAEHARRVHAFYAATCERFAWGQVQLTPDFFARVPRRREKAHLAPAMEEADRLTCLRPQPMAG
jgi:predicted N-acyltransferase